MTTTSGTIEIVVGDQCRQLPIPGDKPLSIGRHPDNIVVLADTQASRYHCVIERLHSQYQLRDLKSRNGTLVNGEKVQAAFLQTGDVIQIGSTMIRLLAAVASSAAAPAQPARHKTKIPGEISGNSAAPDEAAGDSGAGGADDVQPIGVLQKQAAGLTDQSIKEAQIDLVGARGQTVHVGQHAGKTGADDAVHTLRLLLTVCLRIHGTDIHFEPKLQEHQVRMRVDGLMVDIVRLPPTLSARLVNLIKVLADIDIAQKHAIQEGHFSAKVSGRHIDFRVSFTPSVHGQKLVVRVLDIAWAPQFITDLRLPDWMLQRLRRFVKQDAGMVLACGPTGSGKTTTLYALLRDIDYKQRNVVTIEDPVEYSMEGITQIPINEHQGQTFSSVLRSVLRQDPDVILVGEVRDQETARIAMQAAMTGHLVLSTVHAKDTIGTLFRLIDLGLEPYLISSAVNLILSQRLVRVLCPACKTRVKPTAEQLAQLSALPEPPAFIYQPAGCPQCLKTGYQGRQAIYELLAVTDEIRDIVQKNPTPQDIRKNLQATPFATLIQTGQHVVAAGLTSLAEIDRVAGFDGT